MGARSCYLGVVGIAQLRWLLLSLAAGAALPACTVPPARVPLFDTGPGVDGGTIDANVDANVDAAVPHDVGPIGFDVVANDVGLSPDAACEFRSSQATLTRLPADIIWVIDNSGSMAPAITEIQSGINGFASQLVTSDLDYRIIVLSLRAATSGRFPVCFPEPLAGPACADNPPLFYQIDVDIRSTQPIEQILGTLAQSPGYTATDAIGGAPWRDLLRPGATRTFVLVSDDDQRIGASTFGTSAGYVPLTELSLEDYPGGLNPFNGSASNTRALGPGILDPSYAGLFDGYTFDAIYGYGSETDPTARCGSGTFPASAGPTYTTLVEHTHGVRAPICNPTADFPMFFDAIAASVVRGSTIDCNVDIPDPPPGMTFQMGRVNVIVRGAADTTVVPYVRDPGACDATRGGWYYDSSSSPTQIILCPLSCDLAQHEVVGTGTALDVQFGCDSIVI